MDDCTHVERARQKHQQPRADGAAGREEGGGQEAYGLGFFLSCVAPSQRGVLRGVSVFSLLSKQKLPEQYEQLLSGQVTASEIQGNPNALQSVIAFVAGNFVVEGTSKEPETMPPDNKQRGDGGGGKRMMRQPRKREVAQSEILQLKEDESPLFSPENPKDLFRGFKKIGEGGVGTVYLAFSKAGEKVALKNLDVSLEQNLVTVEHEIRMMRSCVHPNIVKYHGSYIWEGQLWVCMEYMDGGSLTEMISIW